MRRRGNLSGQNIDHTVEALCIELERAGIESRLRTAFRLTLEEILLIYRDRFGQDAPYGVRLWKHNGDLYVLLRIAGEELDPFMQDSIVLNRLLERFRNVPSWRYKKRKNLVRFVFTLYNTTRKNLAFSWKYTTESRRVLIIAVVFQIISVLLGVLAPAVSAKVIIAYTQNEVERVVDIALVLLLVQVLRNLFLVLSNQSYNNAYTKTLSALEKDLVDNVLRVESRCIDEKGSGLFIQRITTDTERIASGFNSLADMVMQMLNYLGVLIAMFLIHPLIALFVLFLLVVQCLMELLRTKRLYKDDRIFRSANERFSGLVGEMVRGHKDVKLLSSEEQFSAELDERIREANFKRLSMQARSWRAKLLRWELGEIGTFALLVLMVWLITKDVMTASLALVIFNYYTEIGPNAVKVIGAFMDSVADFNISNERVHALLTSPEFPKERFGKTELKEPRGEITFDHVSFAYNTEEGQNVLNDMCFTIRPGEMIGLVGKSGSGKSTTFSLISRLYEASGGRVLLDGIDIRELTRDSIRRNMTVVTQYPYFFRMSVRDNLKIVKADMTDEEMERVCRLSCMDEDIRNMPDGYDTLIGEGGVNLSGGQRQRLAIARCMLQDSRILLLDEATSALDNATQAKIQQAIDNMRKSKTVVIIAHRLSTIVGADRIFFLQDGEILSAGTHGRLLESCEPYRLLYRKEAEAER